MVSHVCMFDYRGTEIKHVITPTILLVWTKTCHSADCIDARVQTSTQKIHSSRRHHSCLSVLQSTTSSSTPISSCTRHSEVLATDCPVASGQNEDEGDLLVIETRRWCYGEEVNNWAGRLAEQNLSRTQESLGRRECSLTWHTWHTSNRTDWESRLKSWANVFNRSDSISFMTAIACKSSDPSRLLFLQADTDWEVLPSPTMQRYNRANTQAFQSKRAAFLGTFKSRSGRQLSACH